MDTKITIVYDNCLKKRELKIGWGFSAFIETRNESPILFDTSNDGAALLYNMEKLGIDPNLIGAVVISHVHYDHTGGLTEVLEVNNKYATIYLPASMTRTILGRKVISVSQPLQITGNVFSTGELKNIEQSLVIKTGRGILIIGCSHACVGTILDAASFFGEIYGIVSSLNIPLLFQSDLTKDVLNSSCT